MYWHDFLLFWEYISHFKYPIYQIRVALISCFETREDILFLFLLNEKLCSYGHSLNPSISSPQKTPSFDACNRTCLILYILLYSFNMAR